MIVTPMVRASVWTIGFASMLAGCSFQSSGLGVNRDAPVSTTIDAPVSSTIDAPLSSTIDAAPTIHVDAPHVASIDARRPDATPIIVTPDASTTTADSQIATATGACHVSDPDLVMCADFETSPITSPIADGLGSGLGISANSSVMSTLRLKADLSSENAASVSSVLESGMTIAETSALNISDAMTVELWLFMTGLPSSVGLPHYGLVDNLAQYTVLLNADGTLACTFQGNGTGGDGNTNNTFFTAATTAKISTLAWHHIACTCDGTNIRAYIDGSLAAAATGPSPIATNGTVGTSIGSDISGTGSVKNRVTGAIDNVRIWKRALSQADICVAGGISPCPAN